MKELKPVLEYAEDELNQLSIEELKLLEHQSESSENTFNVRQLVEKVLMNSLN